MVIYNLWNVAGALHNPKKACKISLEICSIDVIRMYAELIIALLAIVEKYEQVFSVSKTSSIRGIDYALNVFD